MKKRLTLKQIEAELKRMDPNLMEDSDTFHTAILMLAALQIGTDDQKLATFTGMALDWITLRGERLRKAGIWSNGKTYADWGGEDGGMNFWIDVCIAEGYVERSK